MQWRSKEGVRTIRLVHTFSPFLKEVVKFFYRCVEDGCKVLFFFKFGVGNLFMLVCGATNSGNTPCSRGFNYAIDKM